MPVPQLPTSQTRRKKEKPRSQEHRKWKLENGKKKRELRTEH
jgi:hypothetical protein